MTATSTLHYVLHSSNASISFGIGLLSVIIWTVALVPQVISNIRSTNVESQSPAFWLLWIIGDCCNLAGCILANQLATQTAVAVVFLVITIVLFIQYCYYSRRAAKASNPVAESALSVGLLGATVAYSGVLSSPVLSPSRRVLLSVESDAELGKWLGWAMTVIYMASRVPQIVKLIRLRRSDGLSKSMFALTFLGNATYVTAVLVESTEPAYLNEKLPWLVDGFGTMLQDIFIYFLLCYFTPEDKSNYITLDEDLDPISLHSFDSAA